VDSSDDLNAGTLGQGARLVLAAVVSAIVTATVVITVGQSVIDRRAPDAAQSGAVLLRTSG
jgi:hypothetical protein